jgi:23S rRNA pseudouridine1911/1915/1917 synthase
METIIAHQSEKASSNAYTFRVEESHKGHRIDKFLSQVLPSYSRSFFQQLIDTGNITLNNRIATKASSALKSGDVLTITIPEPEKRPPYNPITGHLGIEILYAHEHFFIIHKPAGLLVHQTEIFTQEPTVVDWLLSHHQELQKVGSNERPGIVHRLDKDTSGLLIIARTNYAHLLFSDMFKKRTISKTYLALVHGHPPASGTIDLSIGRHPTHRKKMTTFIPDAAHALATTPYYSARSQSTARNATTTYTVKTYFNQHALIEVTPLTGRTHQIRVHCAAIGHPLVGDSLYGTPSKLINRHALHATALSFTFAGQHFNSVKDVPEDFKRLIELVS